MRSVDFTGSAFKDFVEWSQRDSKIHQKIATLILDAVRDPFSGLGKPEPLKHNYKGCWSRRITEEHRLVYKVTDTSIIIVSCKFHY